MCHPLIDDQNDRPHTILINNHVKIRLLNVGVEIQICLNSITANFHIRNIKKNVGYTLVVCKMNISKNIFLKKLFSMFTYFHCGYDFFSSSSRDTYLFIYLRDTLYCIYVRTQKIFMYVNLHHNIIHNK